MAVEVRAPKKSKKSPKVEVVVHDPPPAEVTTTAVDVESIWIDDALNRKEAPTPASVEELARSIASSGLQQPIGVTKFGAPEGTVRLVWGRRRYEAVKRLGWAKVPAVFRDRIDSEQELLVDRLVENIQRKDPTPIDEALIVARLIGVYEVQAALGPTANPEEGDQLSLLRELPREQQLVARKEAIRRAAEYLGKSEEWVRDRGFLAKLGRDEQALVESGRLPLLHAREICKVADPEARRELARAAAVQPNGLGRRRREFPMEFEELRTLVSQQVLSLAQVPWDLGVAFAGKPACMACPHNSANNPGLFDHGARISKDPAAAKSRYAGRLTSEPKAGACTNRACYAVKSATAKRTLQTTARRLVKEAKGLKPKDRPSWQRPATLSRLSTPIPEYLDKFDVARAAAEIAKGKAKKEEPSPAASYVSPAGPNARRADPNASAKTELEIALRKRCKYIEPLVAEALKQIPGAWAMLQVVLKHTMVRSTRDQNAKPEKLARIYASSEFRQLMEAVASPSVEGLIRIERGCGRNFGIFDAWYDGPSGLAEQIAKALEIDVEGELGPAPTLDDFLPDGKKARKKGGQDLGKVSGPIPGLASSVE